MIVSQGSLVIVGANTPECKIFWNGKELSNLEELTVANTFGDSAKVVIKIKEDPIVEELTNAGIIVRRV